MPPEHGTSHSASDPAHPTDAASTGTPQRRETIGHRLRSPLHAILGYVGLLKADAGAKHLEQLGIIHDSACELLASIDDLPESVTNMPFPARTLAASRSDRTSKPDLTSLPPLPVDEVRVLRDLLQLGRLIDIEQWAAQLGERWPDHAESSRQIETLAREANLPELHRLLSVWLNLTANP